MRSFTSLYFELDETNRTSQKLAALKRYFRETPPADAIWALYFLSGDRLKRLIPSKLLREWALEQTALPEWLLAECYDTVGDFAETLALLLPEETGRTDVSLHQLIEEQLQPLALLPDSERKALLLKTWGQLDQREKLVWNKMITGEFRVGVSKTLVIRAVADVAGVSPGIMAHRLMGQWRPTADVYDRLVSTDATDADITRPYPFYLAYPLNGPAADLGPIEKWQAEWKWDGIRGQVVKRGPRAESQDPSGNAGGLDSEPSALGTVSIWSRGEELVTERFPEIQKAASTLPVGTVMDGEILGWRDGRPLPFAHLQHRLGRKKVSAKLQSDYPVVFMVYDLLELKGQDLRARPLSDRRAELRNLIAGLPDKAMFPLSPTLEARSWEDVATHFQQSRAGAVEGVMLKRKASPYRVGRQKGDWWKWKIDPYHIDAVLIYALQGQGRRASLYTDYTFGVWSSGKLVPIAKAYSGLTDEEIRKVDSYVRRNTLERFGPVRVVKPELVFELAFEGIQLSGRHKAGVAVRFPRMSRWRQDKKADEADTLDSLKKLISPFNAGPLPLEDQALTASSARAPSNESEGRGDARAI